MIKGQCEEVVLEAEVTNSGALALYQNLGFIRDKRLHRYVTSLQFCQHCFWVATACNSLQATRTSQRQIQTASLTPLMRTIIPLLIRRCMWYFVLMVWFQEKPLVLLFLQAQH